MDPAGVGAPVGGHAGVAIAGGGGVITPTDRRRDIGIVFGNSASLISVPLEKSLNAFSKFN